MVYNMGDFLVTNCTFNKTFCAPGGAGGAIVVLGHVRRFTVHGGTFLDNRAGSSGGSIATFGAEPMTHQV